MAFPHMQQADKLIMMASEGRESPVLTICDQLLLLINDYVARSKERQMERPT